MTTPLLPGRAAPSFDDPLGVLAACHDRIRRQFETLARLQAHLPEHGCSDDARTAARAVLRYFDSAAAQHHADEDESLLPRLVQLCGEQARALAGELGRDHHQLAMRVARLQPYLVAIERGERADLPADVVEDARMAYDRHMRREETEVIPLATRALDEAALAAIGAEMAARRGIDPRTPKRAD